MIDLFDLRHPEYSAAQQSLQDALRERDKPRAEDFDTVSDERLHIDALRLAHQQSRFMALYPSYFADLHGGVIDVADKCRQTHARIENEWAAMAMVDALAAYERGDYSDAALNIAIARTGA